jgi:hypothetical protein
MLLHGHVACEHVATAQAEKGHNEDLPRARRTTDCWGCTCRVFNGLAGPYVDGRRVQARTLRVNDDEREASSGRQASMPAEGNLSGAAGRVDGRLLFVRAPRLATRLS